MSGIGDSSIPAADVYMKTSVERVHAAVKALGYTKVRVVGHDIGLMVAYATPEALVKGRERTFFEHFWNDFAADPKRSIPEADRQAYTRAYSAPGRMAAGFAYFASFPKTATDFAELAKTRLAIPVLSIGGDKSLGDALGAQVRLISPDVTVIVLKDAGHWIMEERPAETMDALVKFLR